MSGTATGFLHMKTLSCPSNPNLHSGWQTLLSSCFYQHLAYIRHFCPFISTLQLSTWH